MTRVSDININDTTRRCTIETTDDCNCLLYTEHQREQYIAEFGDVVVEYDAYYKKYTVAAHKVERDKAIAIKAKHCMQYGSN
jgi:hypothetical protein